MKYSIVVVVLLLCSCGEKRVERILPFAPDPSAPIHRILQQHVTVNFKDADIEDVIAYIRQVSGMGMMVTPRVSAAQPTTITLKLNDVRLGTVILFVQQITNYKIFVQDDILVFDY